MSEERPVGEAPAVSPDENIVEVEVLADDRLVEGADASTEDPIQVELARLQQEAGLLREQYLRKLADFDNFRKRKDKEMSDFRKQANADLLRDMLPVVDNLERALAVGGEDASGVRTGVELTLKQFKDTLARHGVVELSPEGQPFNPTEHEAVSRLHTSAAEPNTVLQVLQKGYRLGDRLLRAAMVVVAAPAMPAPAGGGVAEEVEA
jgi:molecular chaperone GrpE